MLRFDEEKQPSTYKEGRWDTPLDALKFIKRFAKQNMHLLKDLNVINRYNLLTYFDSSRFLICILFI